MTRTTRDTKQTSVKRLFVIPSALLLYVLTACSGQNTSDSIAGTPSDNSYPSTEPGQETTLDESSESTDVESSFETIAQPQLTLRFKDAEGWSWRVSFQGGPKFLDAFKIVETSPPGKATGRVEFTNPFNMSYENLDEGRIPPAFQFEVLIGFNQVIPEGFYGQEFYDGCYTQAAGGLNSSYAVCEIGWKSPDSGPNYGFRLLGGPASSYDLDENEEATIDSIVSFLNRPATSLYIAVPGTWGCVFEYDFVTKVWTDNDKGCEIFGQPSGGSSDANEAVSEDGANESVSDASVVAVECSTYDPNESIPLIPCQKGNTIKLIQQHLSDMGFAVEADGYYGPSTFDAVAEFQRQEGLDVTGTIDELTFERLS